MSLAPEDELVGSERGAGIPSALLRLSTYLQTTQMRTMMRNRKQTTPMMVRGIQAMEATEVSELDVELAAAMADRRQIWSRYYRGNF